MPSILRRSLLAAASLAACVKAAPAASDRPLRPPGPPAVLIQNVRVFDGKTDLGPKDVLLEAGTIQRVGAQLPLPPGAERVDGQGHTLLPGFIDAHVHVWSAAQLRQATRLGVTTVLDMMNTPENVRRLRAEVESSTDLADLRSSGNAVTSPGGHGTEYGFPVPTLRRPEDANSFVAARKADGADYIKIVYTPGSKALTSISRASLEATIEAAHRHGRLAVVHVEREDEAREALEAGADGLVHAFDDALPSGEWLVRSRERGAFVIPTLSVLRSVCGEPHGPTLAKDSSLAPHLDEESRTHLHARYPEWTATGGCARSRAVVKAMRDAGMPLLAGSDAPNPGTAHGASLHGELELLVEAGLSPVEALSAATSVPAKAFGLHDRGRIAEGGRADLVLVRGNPLQDIRASRNIVQVWRAGHRVDRATQVPTQGGGKAPLPEGVEPGQKRLVLSDFEEGAPTARFGSEWQLTTDSLAGGKSEATLKLVNPGAQGTHGALSVAGALAKAEYAWAGVIHHPGGHFRAARDLSLWKGFSFLARGNPSTYAVLLFTRRGGQKPAMRTFEPRPEWTEHRFAFEDFEGADGSDVTGISIVAIGAPRPFALFFDAFTLQ